MKLGSLYLQMHALVAELITDIAATATRLCGSMTGEVQS